MQSHKSLAILTALMLLQDKKVDYCPTLHCTCNVNLMEGLPHRFLRWCKMVNKI